jgi:hypothetical protein
MELNEKERSQVISSLKCWAKISDYYLRKFPESSTYLINYVDESCTSWTLMEDDEDFLDLCVEYLKEIGAHEVNSHDEMEQYIQSRDNTNQ